MKTLHETANVLMIMALSGWALSTSVWLMAMACMTIEFVLKWLRGA